MSEDKLYKSPIDTSIPFGLYIFDHNYVNHIRHYDRAVLDPERSDLYCGPLYTSDDGKSMTSFYAPIIPLRSNDHSDAYSKPNPYAIVFSKGKHLFAIDCRQMLPNSPLCMSAVAENELPHFLSFCKQNKEKLYRCADLVINPIYDGTREHELANAALTPSEIPSDIPFGLYRVNEDRIYDQNEDFLASYPPDKTTLYLGPVYTSDYPYKSAAYFAPIIQTKEKYPSIGDESHFNYMEYRESDDKPFKHIYFDAVIVCDESHLTPVEMTPDFKDYCETYRYLIKYCADFLINPKSAEIHFHPYDANESMRMMRYRANFEVPDIRKLLYACYNPDADINSIPIMEYNESPTPSPIEPELYEIDKDYIRYLRSIDRRVIDPDKENYYYGPVMTIRSKYGDTAIFGLVHKYMIRKGRVIIDCLKYIPATMDYLTPIKDKSKICKRYIVPDEDRRYDFHCDAHRAVMTKMQKGEIEIDW